MQASVRLINPLHLFSSSVCTSAVVLCPVVCRRCVCWIWKALGTHHQQQHGLASGSFWHSCGRQLP